MRFPPTVEVDPSVPATDPNPETQALEASDRSRLVLAVRNLPLAYRQVATLTLEGLTANEIAETLGITANAVTIRLSRTRNLLRKSMGEDA
jgi:RNA polymerase sigma-70 factor (ECF subfamily)